MTLRAPLLSPDAVPNRFGWRHEGPGPQLIADDTPMDGELLPAAAFDHPALQRRPPYVPERLGLPTFSFALRKSCAGLAYEYRRDPEGIYERIMGKALVAEDGAALRWMLSGLQFPTQFVRLHTCGRLTIEELAYMARSAFGNRGAYRTWLNQWGRSPERALPSLPGSILLERPDELVGLDLRDMPPGDDRRIDRHGKTYVKLNGHIYRLPTHLLEPETPYLGLPGGENGARTRCRRVSQ